MCIGIVMMQMQGARGVCAVLSSGLFSCYLMSQTAIETHLRSAVQKQLEGVQKGLRGMKEAEKAVKEIKVSMGEVEQLYQQCSELSEVVRPIKEVNKRHQQVCIGNATIKV